MGKELPPKSNYIEYSNCEKYENVQGSTENTIKYITTQLFGLVILRIYSTNFLHL